MSDVNVREVSEPRDLAAFDAVAHLAQRANPRWTAPLKFETRHVFDRRRSPLMKDNRIRLFLAYRNEQPVGRIAVIINHAHIEKYRDGTGHFGLVEAVDDAAVFAALFSKAAATVRSYGLTAMQGPFSLTINHETGLLVEGYTAPHVVRTNHAPPYYARHFEAAGLTKVIDLLAATCPIAENPFPRRVKTLVSTSRVAPLIKTRGINLLSWRRDFPTILQIYNDAWQDNWGAVPVQHEEAKMIAELMLPVSKPSWMRLAYWNGNPIATVVQIPDVNEALQPLRGNLLPFGWAHLMSKLHLQGTKRSRLPMVGVVKRWRGTEVGSLAIRMLLAEALEQALRAGVEETEISWMLETNTPILKLAQSMSGTITRRFRVYGGAV